MCYFSLSSILSSFTENRPWSPGKFFCTVQENQLLSSCPIFKALEKCSNIFHSFDFCSFFILGKLQLWFITTGEIKLDRQHQIVQGWSDHKWSQDLWTFWYRKRSQRHLLAAFENNWSEGSWFIFCSCGCYRQPEKSSEYQTLVLNNRPFGKALAVPFFRRCARLRSGAFFHCSMEKSKMMPRFVLTKVMYSIASNGDSVTSKLITFWSLKLDSLMFISGMK